MSIRPSLSLPLFNLNFDWPLPKPLGKAPHTFSNPKTIGLFFIQNFNPCFFFFFFKTTLDRISSPDLSFQNSCLSQKYRIPISLTLKPC
jgi:hypothetical protein